jgi:antitoxin (DNA-binding transcriptional repressor) of toxin-antitoxin stability system
VKVYTYSEARQRLAQVLDEAKAGGDVRIKRQDGTEFSVRPVRRDRSPLDVVGVASRVTAADIISALRETRERGPTGSR